MEKGKLYIAVDGSIIVLCTSTPEEHNSKSGFGGTIIKSFKNEPIIDYHQEPVLVRGVVDYGWDIERFVPLNGELKIVL